MPGGSRKMAGSLKRLRNIELSDPQPCFLQPIQPWQVHLGRDLPYKCSGTTCTSSLF